VEQFENSVPILITEKSLIPDSGGAGEFRGGQAQRLSFKVVSKDPVTMTIRHERVKYPPRGLLGGRTGSPGCDYVNGERIPAKSRMDLKNNDVVTFDTAGGGGIGSPEKRSEEKIIRDLESGVVTKEAAERDYAFKNDEGPLDV
jgi:N-methylhydantoinase B